MARLILARSDSCLPSRREGSFRACRSETWELQTESAKAVAVLRAAGCTSAVESAASSGFDFDSILAMGVASDAWEDIASPGNGADDHSQECNNKTGQDHRQHDTQLTTLVTLRILRRVVHRAIATTLALHAVIASQSLPAWCLRQAAAARADALGRIGAAPRRHCCERNTQRTAVRARDGAEFASIKFGILVIRGKAEAILHARRALVERGHALRHWADVALA
eukprot:4330292-Prymnesium_polylepis.1